MLTYQEICQTGSRKVEKIDLKGKQVKSPLLMYLSEVEKNKISPKGFGFVHRKKKDEININSFYLNDQYIDAFSKGISLAK